jgi:hypothetical protein
MIMIALSHCSPTLFKVASILKELSRKVTAFQTPVPVTPSETAVKNTELQLHFGYPINDTENICNNKRIASYIVTIHIYSLSQ